MSTQNFYSEGYQMGRKRNIAGLSPIAFDAMVDSCTHDEPPNFKACQGFRADGTRSCSIVIRQSFAPNYFSLSLTDAWNRTHALPGPLHVSDWPKLVEYWELEDCRWQGMPDSGVRFLLAQFPREALKEAFTSPLSWLYVSASEDSRGEGDLFIGRITTGFAEIPDAAASSGHLQNGMRKKLLCILDQGFPENGKELSRLGLPVPGREVEPSPKLLNALADQSAEMCRKFLYERDGDVKLWNPHFMPPKGLS